MELIQKTIRYNQEGKKTFDQFYLDEDYNVPDAKQDVRRIIKGQGTVKIEDVKLVFLMFGLLVRNCGLVKSTVG